MVTEKGTGGEGEFVRAQLRIPVSIWDFATMRMPCQGLPVASCKGPELQKEVGRDRGK